jgi:hypothetical protein
MSNINDNSYPDKRSQLYEELKKTLGTTLIKLDITDEELRALINELSYIIPKHDEPEVKHIKYHIFN